MPSCARALPILDELIKANQQRAEDAMGGQHPIWLFLLGVVVLVALVWLNRELARHFRRRINKGIAVAAVIVLVVTLVTVAGAGSGTAPTTVCATVSSPPLSTRPTRGPPATTRRRSRVCD